MAELIPFLVDVDAETQGFRPGKHCHCDCAAPAAVGGVLPVAPFGRPTDVVAWYRFRSRTGLPVVIDAAAGFDTITLGAAPTVISLHATKVFGVGEGGFVMKHG